MRTVSRIATAAMALSLSAGSACAFEANVAALPMGADGGFITGSGFLMDRGVTASHWFGELAPSASPSTPA